MPEDLPYVYDYFRSKGFGRLLSLAMALYCCDPDRPYLETTK